MHILLCSDVGCAQSPINDFSFDYQDGSYYLADSNGKIIKSIKSFTYAEPFSEGLALVEKNLRFDFIDTTGNRVLHYQFLDAGSFSNGLAYASLCEKYVYISIKGKFVIEPQFDIVCDFMGEYARVLIKNPEPVRYGFIQWVQGLIYKEGNLISNRHV